MHRCLTVGDVTKLICDQLKYDYGDRPDIKSLRSLALTSKVMLEPALKALWRHQTSLDPLLLLIPANFDGCNAPFDVRLKGLLKVCIVP